MFRTILLLATSVLMLDAAAPRPPASDAVIESTIRAKFAKSKINEEHFKVTVKSGVATIEGKTSVPQRKGAATRMAKTGGARSVTNRIEVSAAARQVLADRLQKGRDQKAAAPASPTSIKPSNQIAPQIGSRLASRVASPGARQVPGKVLAPTVPPVSTPVAKPEPPALRRMQIQH